MCAFDGCLPLESIVRARKHTDCLCSLASIQAKGGLLTFPQPLVPGQPLPWILPFDSITLDNITLSSSAVAIIDSSIPGLIAPSGAFKMIYDNLNIYNLTDDLQEYGVSCGAVKSFPPIVFHSGGKNLTLDPSFWITQVGTRKLMLSSSSD